MTPFVFAVAPSHVGAFLVRNGYDPELIEEAKRFKRRIPEANRMLEELQRTMKASRRSRAPLQARASIRQPQAGWWDPWAFVPRWEKRTAQTALDVSRLPESPTAAQMKALGAKLADRWRTPAALANALGVQVREVKMGALDYADRRVLARTLVPPFASSPVFLIAAQGYADMDRATAHEIGHYIAKVFGEGSESLSDAFSEGWMGVPR